MRATIPPSRVPNAITVGAVDSTDLRPSYSNQGPCVDVFAPGSGITSVANWDDVSARSMSGTSMAAPHVAGVAALYLETHPTASAATVAQQIQNAATSGVITNIPVGTVNKLLDSFLDGSAPVAPGKVTISSRSRPHQAEPLRQLRLLTSPLTSVRRAFHWLTTMLRPPIVMSIRT
jgi:subtilisin family serine protease